MIKINLWHYNTYIVDCEIEIPCRLHERKISSFRLSVNRVPTANCFALEKVNLGKQLNYWNDKKHLVNNSQ